MKRALIFAPHPDDETLACGGTIAKKLSDGYDVSIVFVTDGRHSLTDLGISSRPTPLELKEIRREEAFRAARILGITDGNLLFLDFEDGTLSKQLEQFQERVVEILKDVAPEEIFFPQEREYNVDHRMTNLAVRKALSVLDITPIRYRYIVAWMFPFYLLVHAVNEPTFDQVMVKLSKADLARVDVSRFLSLKEKAIKEYQSQISLISPGQTRPALKPSFVKRFSRKEEKFFVVSNNRNVRQHAS
jgi:LmbE family N-acetylglucosaminyl deacetylase